MKHKAQIWMGWVVLAALVTVSLPAGVSSAQEPAPAAVDIRGFSAVSGLGGEPWVVWAEDDGYDSDLYYSRWTEWGWLQARPLHDDPTTWEGFPSLAIAAGGTPWVAWSSGTAEEGILNVSRWVGYRWSTPMQVPVDPASHPQQPALAAAPDGTFWLAWIGFDGNDDEIFASHWDGSGWSPPELVGQDDDDPLAYDAHPRLAVGDDGLPWLVWVSSQGLHDDVVLSSHWDGRSWLPEQPVSAPDNTPDAWPSLALDSDGQPWVAWQDRVGSGPEARLRILVSRWRADGTGWSPEELASSSLSVPVDEETPHLSFDAEGQPHLVWSVWGQTPGVAYATWDGSAWTQAAWAAEQVATDEAVLLPADAPWLLWPDLAPTGRVPLGEQRLVGPLSTLPDFEIQTAPVPFASSIPDRYLAAGDSITLGDYDDPEGSGIPVGPYPERLEEKLDTRVRESEMFNRGVSGELTNRLRDRISVEIGTLQPQFTLAMEGTNDITHGKTPSTVIDNLEWIVSNLKKYVKLDGHVLWFSTVIPRMDDLNSATKTLNNYIRDFCREEGQHCTDSWDAFYDYGKWQDLMRDSKHPNGLGMQILADNWYQDLLDTHSGLYEDTQPPTTWMEPLPAQVACGEVTVKWNGTDNTGYVAQYDVQTQINGGTWTDWIMATTDTSSVYNSQTYGSTVAFRVRGRDAIGNESAWSTPVSTQISDDGPPQVQMNALPTAQKAPFTVSWSGTDTCGQVTAYDVQYRVGPAGTWQNWLQSTASTSADFTPTSPKYGQAYAFQMRARDEAGNWSGWSAAVSTLLARFAVEGEILNVRDEPVSGATATAAGALAADVQGSNYAAYLAAEGSFDLSVSHDRFGLLPPMHVLSVTADVDGLDLVLPPLDDVVSDGDFESGAWGNWTLAGSLSPTRTAEAHSGDGAVLLGGMGEDSQLKQTISIPGDLTDATLSFLARLNDDADGSSILWVELEGTAVSATKAVPAGDWMHIWLPVDEAVLGKQVTLTFTVSDKPAIRLDEVSLGSALKGGSWVYLPIVRRAITP